ncbi:MAG: hypothetical protein II481_03350, partial [Clostridia bacterium]|nr:hypothetical protein [Clostridia bacterium]
MSAKYVFVTGGVVSSLGKGITAASIGRLLKARGYRVSMQDITTSSHMNRRVQEILDVVEGSNR